MPRACEAPREIKVHARRSMFTLDRIALAPHDSGRVRADPLSTL
ncbi:cytochrome c oxidase family protein [Burkholderia pseudomallei 1710a]|uniref:Cytochrome c oxidase family protein n=1 Tax=Burkholderia pseudomallei 1710a TaxID=320371 RepID=A0A0E1WC90_BURPE|nr:cytochrome c oxidase family protein [Burkholderia pseudomallei 1710a]